MIKANFSVVIDACVLANFAVCDLLLRLAERPTLYQPRWSETILAETRRTHEDKLHWEHTFPHSAGRYWKNLVTATEHD